MHVVKITTVQQIRMHRKFPAQFTSASLVLRVAQTRLALPHPLPSLPLPPTSHKWGPQAPTSPPHVCTRRLSALRGPETRGCHRRCWYECRATYPPCKGQSQQSWQNHLCPAKDYLASSLYRMHSKQANFSCDYQLTWHDTYWLLYCLVASSTNSCVIHSGTPDEGNPDITNIQLSHAINTSL